MTAQWLFLASTILKWAGWAFLFAALASVVRMAATRSFGGPLQRVAVRNAWVGGVMAVLGQCVPADIGRVVEPGFWLPIVWVYMVFPGWMVVIGLAMAGASAVQSLSALTPAQAKAGRRAVVWWLATATLGAVWFSKWDPKVTVLRGALHVQLTTLAGLLALAVVAVWVMAKLQRRAAARGQATKLVQHVVLVAGCVVFGIPFAWMLVTSFKEERDMANTNGAVWIPKVQLTHDYFDPDHPLVQVKYEGRWILANVLHDDPGGQVDMEIERPYLLRGRTFAADKAGIKAVPRKQPIWSTTYDAQKVTAFTVQEMPSGKREVEILTPDALKGQRFQDVPENFDPVRRVGLRWENYSEALEWMPFEADYGLRYLQNTLVIVVMSVIGTVLSSSLVAYGFGRLRFPGRDVLFNIMLATMMLPAAVTMLPRFLIFRWLGWIDTLLPLWVPAFFASAFNVFLLRQFFSTIPMELEEAARIDGCSYLTTFWKVMLPQVKPALAAIAIWTFMGAWNDFMGPLIYIMSPENVPLSYALQLFSGDRGSDFGLMMAFSTMTVLPVVLLFFVAQRYFIEGVQLSGLGGR